VDLEFISTLLSGVSIGPEEAHLMHQIKGNQTSDFVYIFVSLFKQKRRSVILIAIVLELNVDSRVHDLIFANGFLLLSKVHQVDKVAIIKFLSQEVALIVYLNLLNVFSDPRNYFHAGHLPFVNRCFLIVAAIKDIKVVL